MRRLRRVKIIATLGPSSSTIEVIERLFRTGADVFRLNFSHGSHEDHAERILMIREVEKLTGRPVGILADVQGPVGIRQRGGYEVPSSLLAHEQRIAAEGYRHQVTGIFCT